MQISDNNLPVEIIYLYKELEFLHANIFAFSERNLHIKLTPIRTRSTFIDFENIA